MKTKLLNRGPERTYAVVLETGDEAMQCLAQFAAGEGLDCARFTAIGALSDAVLGYFDLQQKDYQRLPVDQQTELLSLIGDIARGPDGKPQIHAHAVLGRRDGSTRGGHLICAHVRPTMEVIVMEAPSYLRRCLDPTTGLALIDLDA